MKIEEVVRQLELAHFLRGLPEGSLVNLAESLGQRNYQAGEIILGEGEPPGGLRLIHNGRVELLQEASDGTFTRLGEEEQGGLLGVGALLSGHRTRAAARAMEPTEILFWEKNELFPFLEDHPSALESLQLAAASQELSWQMRFGWLREDEAIFALARKHVARLAFSMTIPLLLAAAAVALGFWSIVASPPLLPYIAGFFGIAALAYGLWLWVDWRNDYYIVTDQRVVWVEKVVAIYDSQVEAPLHQVLAVSVSSDVIGRWLGYGDVITRTYTGQIRFRHIGSPRAVAAVIEERWRRLQLSDRNEDRASKLEAVRQILNGEEQAAEPAQADPAESLEPAKDNEATPDIGLNHWNLELRFEHHGVITYRKHWAVLLGRIGLPSLLLLLVTGLAGARLAGWIELAPTGPFLLATGGAALLLFGWWIYQFADWANDIYQVSPTHILDVYRKPLGRELRRAAPLENILSTEVDRRGIIGLVLDFGVVRVNVGAEQLDFEGVFHPRMVQQDIVRAQEAFMAKQRQSEEQQRRREMIEWLGAYHDEMTSQHPEAREDPDIDVYP
ncbi:MAG: cyclic nucleotide-binding domain-containing protein [Anaerolineales bacterium]